MIFWMYDKSAGSADNNKKRLGKVVMFSTDFSFALKICDERVFCIVNLSTRFDICIIFILWAILLKKVFFPQFVVEVKRKFVDIINTREKKYQSDKDCMHINVTCFLTVV